MSDSLQERFLHGVDNWCNHRPLLWLALEETKGVEDPVVELGMGDGSTPYLHDYCEENERYVRSYDSTAEWSERFAHFRSRYHQIRSVGKNWDDALIEERRWSVALVDHSPADRRIIDVGRLSNRCDIIVVHDTEPESRGYGFTQEFWGSFKYRVDVKTDGAWATAVSHIVDVTKWRGMTVGGFVIT